MRAKSRLCMFMVFDIFVDVIKEIDIIYIGSRYL